MHQSPFRRVAEALPRHAESILRDLGVRHVKHGTSFHWRNEWEAGFLCPWGCGDTSGSASIKVDGYSYCHQCGRKGDLFDIWTHVHGGDTWTACKAIAEIAGVDISTPKTKHRSMPRRMTRDVLAQAVHELLEADHAQAARQFLAARGLYAPRALAELGIGFCRGYLVFAQFTESG